MEYSLLIFQSYYWKNQCESLTQIDSIITWLNQKNKNLKNEIKKWNPLSDSETTYKAIIDSWGRKIVVFQKNWWRNHFRTVDISSLFHIYFSSQILFYRVQATHRVRLSVTTPTIEESVSVPSQRRFLALNTTHQSDENGDGGNCIPFCRLHSTLQNRKTQSFRE